MAALPAWQAAFAQRPLARAACAAMAAKYAALAALEALPVGPEQNAALRRAASRWPGCLRESQLAGPERCAERRAWAEAGALAPERPRAAWLADGSAAVPLWADLHLLLGDLLAWRASGGAGGAAELLAGLGRMDAWARARWPDAELLVRVAGDRVRVRQAYRWLAAQAGLSLPALNYALFARQGHWDARPDDPPVSA